ncbi:MAG: IS21 family transposase [Elusimicrobiota bacterium]
MIDASREAEIRRLFFAEHWTRGTIAAQLGVHPDVVARATGHTGSRGTATPPNVLEPYEPVIDETLAKYPRLRASRIFDMIRARGYSGSLRTLRRYVRRTRPMPKGEAFLRTERLPGEQAQVDWGHVGKIAVPGGERALWVFVMVLAYSRTLWAELVFDLSAHSLRRSLIRAAEFFGGVTRQWLFDNPKTVVLERHGDLVRYHPALLELAATFHVEPRLCAVRKPEQKGAVERAIRFLKERFFPARTIRSIEQGNAQLREFLREVAMPRPHPTISGCTVADVFAEERPRLLALPEILPSADTIVPVVVDKTAFVQFDCNRYSVPPEHIRKTLTLVASDVDVRILERDEVVARHERCFGKKRVLERSEHRAAILDEKRGARQLKGRDRLRVSVPRIDELLARWLEDGRNVGSLTLRTMPLLDLYGGRVLADAVAELLERGQHDLGALAILCEKRRRHRAAVLPLEFGSHVPERDVVPHDLGGYDD